jgi:ferredoxin
MFQLDTASLASLFQALRRRDYRLVGPTVRDGAIVYDEIASPEQLPAGWTEEQSPGSYRLARRDDGALFGFTLGPQSWKEYLFPPERTLWKARLSGDGLEIREPEGPVPHYAFIGARPCELQAIAVHDRVLLEGPFADPSYRRLREELFVVAVNCAEPGGTCFCVSMGTGPRAEEGYDLALTELVDGEEHLFVCETGSPRGAEVLKELPHREASGAERAAAETVSRRAAMKMGRALDLDGLPRALRDGADHPRWDEVARRCLACANCTLVCPTCFCVNVRDVNELGGEWTKRLREWDSCFTNDFSYIAGGHVRRSGMSRYRQWLTHKFSYWVDQFGRPGCVGCGRCITWCPAGIDITEEARALRKPKQAGRAGARSSAQE